MVSNKEECPPEDGTENPSVLSNVSALLNPRRITSQVRSSVKIFPNPTRGAIYARMRIIGDVQVMDVTGQIIYQNRFKMKSTCVIYDRGLLAIIYNR